MFAWSIAGLSWISKDKFGNGVDYHWTIHASFIDYPRISFGLSVYHFGLLAVYKGHKKKSKVCQHCQKPCHYTSGFPVLAKAALKVHAWCA